MKANYLVCYDISDPKRLNRVFRHMKGIGIHLQYSVFHCTLTWAELNELKRRLKELIDAKYDDIKIYPLPANCKIIVLGCGDRMPEGVELL